MQTDAWSISKDGELYRGRYSTKDEAIAEAMGVHGYKSFYVGRCVPPVQPEQHWNAEDWLEHVSCQDEYSCEWADDWDESTRKLREELEVEVRAVMAAWLDRHGLRPKFWMIEDAEEYTVGLNGEAVRLVYGKPV